VLRNGLLLCVLSLCWSTDVFAQNAPSFDCSKAATADERAICGNARLSELDNWWPQRTNTFDSKTAMQKRNELDVLFCNYAIPVSLTKRA